jgi:hypothetical protein
VSRWSDPDASSETSALRDQMTDDSRDGSDVLRKEDVGGFIESSLYLNSPATQDRNPGSPDRPMHPYT